MLVILLNKKVLASSCQHLLKAVISPERALISYDCVSFWQSVNPSDFSATDIKKPGVKIITFTRNVAQIVLTFGKYSTTGAI